MSGSVGIHHNHHDSSMTPHRELHQGAMVKPRLNVSAAKAHWRRACALLGSEGVDCSFHDSTMIKMHGALEAAVSAFDCLCRLQVLCPSSDLHSSVN